MTEVEGWEAIASQIERLIGGIATQVSTFKSTESRINLMKLDRKLTGALEIANKAAAALNEG